MSVYNLGAVSLSFDNRTSPGNKRWMSARRRWVWGEVWGASFPILMSQHRRGWERTTVEGWAALYRRPQNWGEPTSSCTEPILPGRGRPWGNASLHFLCSYVLIYFLLTGLLFGPPVEYSLISTKSYFRGGLKTTRAQRREVVLH